MTNSADSMDGNGNAHSRHALAHWEPRHVLSLDAAQRHSTFIRYARLLLIAFSGVLLLTLLWYFISTPKSKPPEPNPDETVKFTHPVYKGRTVDGLPYRISADTATRFIQNPDETKLVNPVLNFLRSGEAKESQVLALTGLYNAETQVLELHQEVRLKTDDGYDCKTSHARVFVKGKRIEGDEPIDCVGAFGKAAGQAYEINDDYKEFVFKGGMTALIIPDKADEALSSGETIAPLRGGQE
ncbi:MAG: LPS export ABC transporter periplasmic protein LptC [Robiginitomaculum sp.]|nr:LPS export ABC transporter periplasmic protein LptC [Robiginitomaculum sp.]